MCPRPVDEMLLMLQLYFVRIELIVICTVGYLCFIVPSKWILGYMTTRRSGSDQFLGIRRKRMQFKISTSSSCKEWEVRLYILKEKASSSFFFLACSFAVLIESINWKDSRFKFDVLFLSQIYCIMTNSLDFYHVSFLKHLPPKMTNSLCFWWLRIHKFQMCL